MKPMYKLINFFYQYTQRLGICGNTGLIAGITAGLILCFYNIRMGTGVSFTDTEAWQVGMELAVFCWIVVLFFLLLVLRAKLSQVIIPSLINCLIVCFLTVFFVNKFQLFPIAWFVGMVIGILTGFILCQLSKSLHLKR